MNQIVINNRKKIDIACASCFNLLVNYSEKVRSHKKEVEKISASPYVQEEKMRQIDELEAATKDQIRPIWDAVRDQIDAIRQLADEIAEIPLEIVDLSAIGTLSNLIGGASSVDSTADIFWALQDYVDMYRGQPKALSVIKVAMERSGNPDANVLRSKHGGSLIFSVSERIGRLIRVADQLLQPNINHAYDLAREVEVFASDMGVNLSSSFKGMMKAVNSDDYEGDYFSRLASLMGLSDMA